MVPKRNNGTRRFDLNLEQARFEEFQMYHDFGLLRAAWLCILILAQKHGVLIPRGSHGRAKAIDRILGLADPWPTPIMKLAELLLTNAVLDARVRAKVSSRGIRGQAYDQLVQDVKVKLVFVVIRNSFSWCENHWFGHLNQHISTTVSRMAKADRLREILYDDRDRFKDN